MSPMYAYVKNTFWCHLIYLRGATSGKGQKHGAYMLIWVCHFFRYRDPPQLASFSSLFFGYVDLCVSFLGIIYVGTPRIGFVFFLVGFPEQTQKG